LQEELAHRGVDGIADEIGVECLEQRLAGKNLACHGGGMCHARTTDGLDQRLLDDAVLDVESELAGSLLRRTPTDAVREAVDIGNLLCLNPFALFGDGGRTMISPLRDRAHELDLF